MPGTEVHDWQGAAHRRGWSEADIAAPLQHWHSAPYTTLDGYRLEVDAQRIMAAAHADGFAAAKEEAAAEADPLSQLQSAFLGGADIGLPADFSASQADLLADLLRQRQFQGSPSLLSDAPPLGGGGGGADDSPDMLRQKTGKDMPGSDSLTQEEQVSSLTMGGFDDCLFSVDLPLLNIPRPGSGDGLGSAQGSPMSAQFQGMDTGPGYELLDAPGPHHRMEDLLPRRLPRTPQAGAKPAHAGAGGSGNLPRPLTIHMIAAGSDPVQAARPPPSAHYGQQPPPPQHAQHAQHAQQQQRMSACNRSLSMPALPGALHGSPATPTGRGEAGCEEVQSSALAANAAAQAALWRAGSPAPALQGMPPIQPLPPLQHDLSPRNPSGLSGSGEGCAEADAEAVHLAYLTPAHKRKGKGGRQPAADPRLDPGIDPKRARRILANRLSAARSKMKQKSHVETLRRKVEVLTYHKRNLAAEIDKLRAACERRAHHNGALRTKLDELKAHCGMLVRTYNELQKMRAHLLQAAGGAPPAHGYQQNHHHQQHQEQEHSQHQHQQHQEQQRSHHHQQHASARRQHMASTPEHEPAGAPGLPSQPAQRANEGSPSEGYGEDSSKRASSSSGHRS